MTDVSIMYYVHGRRQDFFCRSGGGAKIEASSGDWRELGEPQTPRGEGMLRHYLTKMTLFYGTTVRKGVMSQNDFSQNDAPTRPSGGAWVPLELPQRGSEAERLQQLCFWHISGSGTASGREKCV